MSAPKVDILIPTFNEAGHIAQVVKNAGALGPVFVLDSHSTDGTQELARQAGATVVEHTFVNYSDQKNWGIDNLPFTGDWIFILDADERIPPALREEVAQNGAAEGRDKSMIAWYRSTESPHAIPYRIDAPRRGLAQTK